MNKKFAFLLSSICVVTLCACSSNAPSTVESDLVKGEDYINHADTYDGKKLTYDESMWYVNKLKDVPLPDPFVYVENDTYYIVGTNDRDSSVIDMYITDDFVNYTIKYDVLKVKDFNGWEHSTSPKIYAPEIYKFNDVYYMYYSALNKSNVRKNSVVVSNKIDGPYNPLVIEGKIDGVNSPVFDDGNTNQNVLDSTIFVDDDGQMYMYYAVSGTSSQHVVGVKMISPYEADYSTYVKLIEPGAISVSTAAYKPLSWELLREYGPIAEAPFMLKSNNKYYLTYSVNGCWNKYYNVCYAVGDSPLGNFSKPYKKDQIWTNLLLGYPGTKNEDSTVYKQWSGFASGTGHHCFFKVGDQLMIGYHAHQNRNWNNESKWTARYFAFDYVHFDSNGVPFCNGPTNSIQILPEAISSYKNIAKNAEIKTNNITNAGALLDEYIVESYNLSQEDGKEVSLGRGQSFVELTFDKEYEIGGFAIYNSAYYDYAIGGVKYVDFGNKNAVLDAQFAGEVYVNENYEFVYPNSAITVQFKKEIRSNHVKICFDLSGGGQINEIAIFGK